MLATIYASTAMLFAQQGNDDTAALCGLLCICALVLAFNFLPVLIAMARGHPDTLAIFLVTLLFGWTFIGWCIALIWSVKSIPRDRY